MHRVLAPHPGSHSKTVERIEVDVVRSAAGRLELRYVVTGLIDDVIWPKAAEPNRADELWKHTCFEVFIRRSLGEAYCEFNFSPSSQWAAYSFSGERVGMSPIGEISTPLIELTSSDDQFDMDVVLDLAGLPELPRDEPWRVGVTAVIEEIGGVKSYWALAHPREQPDFHNLGGFVLELPAPELA